MSYEVEIKFRGVDPAVVAERIRSWGGVAAAPVSQVDIYFAHPARDFAQTDEVLRLRAVNQVYVLTYKGPKQGGPTKTREELEVPLAGGQESGERMTLLFQRLGFRPVAEVRKTRTPYHLQARGRCLEVVLDHVDGLGDFVEVETVAMTPDDLPSAQEMVRALARDLGLSEVEPRSYLRMVLERAGRLAPSASEGSPWM